MFPILHVGPLAIQLPGLLLLAGVWVGTYLVEKEAPRHKLSAAVLNNMIFYALVAGLLGARLGYALRFLNVYLENPRDLFSLNPSTLSAVDGLVTAAMVAFVYAYRRKLRLWPTLDALSPALAVFGVIIGLAHLSSGDAFGAPSSLPWSIDLWGERRHPTQVYEILLAGLVAIAVFRLRGRSPFPGFAFLIWVGATAAVRLILEGFRGDSVIVLGQIRLAQPLSLAVLLAALLGLHLLARRRKPRPATPGGT